MAPAPPIEGDQAPVTNRRARRARRRGRKAVLIVAATSVLALRLGLGAIAPAGAATNPLGDADGDHVPDGRECPLSLIHAAYDGTSKATRITYVPSDRNGRFAGLGTTLTVPKMDVGVNTAQSTSFGDLDADGLTDITWTNSTGAAVSNGVTTWTGLGSSWGPGTFTSLPSVPAGQDVDRSTLFGDVDGDGRDDVVFTDQDTGDARTHLTTATGPSTAAIISSNAVKTSQGGTGTAPDQATVLGDVDGDHKLDIVHANSYWDTISVSRGLGDGRFAVQAVYRPGGTDPIGTNASRTVLVLDVNKDGKDDVVAARAGSPLRVWRSTGSGFSAPSDAVAMADAGVSDVEATLQADVDLDGDQDIVYVQQHTGDTTTSYLNQGNGSFVKVGPSTIDGGFNVGIAYLF